MSDFPQANKSYVLIALSLKFAPIEQVLEGTNLSIPSLAKMETINLLEAINIVHNLNKYSYTPMWPTILGNHLGIATHGPVGYAAISAPTLGRALSTFAQWYQVRADSYSATVIEHDDNFEIVITDTTSDEGYAEFFFEAFMRAFEVLIKLLIGQSLSKETELYFKTQAINRRHLMAEAYDSQLHFGSDMNKLLVPKALWFSPSPLYDKSSYDYNLDKCRQLLAEINIQGRIDVAVRDKIREHFEQVIVSCDTGMSPPTLKDICQTLHLTERTLIRKLKKFDTAYKKILADERRKYAVQLLEDVRYSIFNVADILGYREAANFCRAFKNWYQQTPTAYRRNKFR